MIASPVGRLILTDLYLSRRVIGGTLVAGLLALAVMPLGRTAGFVGGVLLICALIILNIVLVMHNVVQERAQKVALFVMSLPVDPSQYVTAKAAAMVIAFGVPWLLLAVATVSVIALSSMPNGLLPFWIVLFGYLLAYSWVLLGVGIATDAAGWHATAIIIGNVSINLLIPFVLSRPAVVLHGQGPVAVWSADLVAMLLLELAIGAVALAIACRTRARRADVL